MRADDQVADAVAVEIAGGAHRIPRVIADIDALENETVGAVEGNEIDARREHSVDRNVLAEDHVAVAGAGREGIARSGVPGPR